MTSQKKEKLDVELKEFLEEKVHLYNRPEFIENDPVAILHNFSLKEDIEIAGFLTASIAWGNRKMILQNARKLMHLMGHEPYDFVMSFKKANHRFLSSFVHRTFNNEDLIYFCYALQHMYQQHGGMQRVFEQHATETSMQPAITAFKSIFFELHHSYRTEKHVADPAKGSAAKRVNMMLRWFVRKDNCGVDLGIWNGVLKPSQLSCPLDVHSGNIARKFGLVTRKQNDAKALLELDTMLRILDPLDPVKFDFALFGLGVMDDFE